MYGPKHCLLEVAKQVGTQVVLKGKPFGLHIFTSTPLIIVSSTVNARNRKILLISSWCVV